jgi:hypothetical protein
MTTQSEQRQKERTSFKDLARLAATPPPSSVAPPSSAWGMGDAGPASQAGRLDPNDSGMVDLKMIATLDPRGAERAKTTPLAASGLFDEEAPPVSARASAPPASMSSNSMAGLGRASIPSERPPMVAQASAQESAPLSLSQPPASISHAPISARAMMGSGAALPQKKKGSGGILLVLGGVVTLAAAAAGGVFYMKTHPGALTASKPAVVEPAAPVVVTPPVAAATETAVVAANDTAPQQGGVDSVVTPETPDQNDAKGVATKAGKHSAGSKTALAPKPEANAKPEAPAATAAPKKPDTKTAAVPGSTDSLGNAMLKAAGPADAVQAEEKPTGPQFAAGTVPQKPANGTVMGAIGAVLPNARACLGPDDPVSRATITFQSTGGVQGVTVSGGAAGKPAEACIKTALGKAKVPPFAEATFTTAITVRP